MRRRMRVTHRPSKASGLMGTVFGGIFVLIGIFIAIPTFGLFGILWTAIAAGITIFNAYAAFGKNKNGSYNEYMGEQIDIETERGGMYESWQSPAGDYAAPDAEDRLRQLQRLLDSGLITGEEYERKREEILREL